MIWLLWLGRVGLLLNFAGGLLLLSAGTPPVYRPRYAVYAPEDYDAKKEEQQWSANVALWRSRTRVGLARLLVGFALQLIGTSAW